MCVQTIRVKACNEGLGSLGNCGFVTTGDSHLKIRGAGTGNFLGGCA